ncbi:MAG: ATP-binding cassette domain-containing protein [Mariprofundales bacterium]
MIQTQQLTRFYGDRAALRDVSFNVRKGEVMGLLGPNGAGKSTTMKILTGFIPPSSGYASVGGFSLAEESISVRRIIGYLPENAPSYAELSVYEHLRFIGRMHLLPDGILAERIRQMAEICGLKSVLRRRIQELSKGFRQRVGLAASMLHDPQCLILDEPTTGLDPNQIIEIRHLIRHISNQLGEQKTVLLSSHVLSEVEASCDRMMILDKGTIAACGTVSELAAQSQGGYGLSLFVRQNASALENILRQRLPQEVTIKTLLSDEQDSSNNDETCLRIQCNDAKIDLSMIAFHAAVEADAPIVEMQRHKISLEDVFRQITGNVSNTGDTL